MNVKFPIHTGPTSGAVVVPKTGRQEVPGSTPGRACRPKSFGVFRGFLRNLLKYGLQFRRKTPTEGTSPVDPGPTSEQLPLKPPTQPNSKPDKYFKQKSCSIKL